MPVSNRDELLAALREADHQKLVGTPESQWLDLKGQPYQLDTAKGAWEWVKDVAAFANAGGGMIVIGIPTTIAPHQQAEVAEAPVPIPKRLLLPKQHIDLLSERLYPAPRGLSVEWYPPEGDKGIAVIDIPRQDERDLPVVVRRMIDLDGKTVATVGVPTRTGTDTAWLRAESLHILLAADRQRGGQADTQVGWEMTRNARWDARLEQIETESEWKQVPCVFLQGAPPRSAGLLKGFLAENGVVGALQNPPTLRRNGFDASPGRRFEVRDGSLVFPGAGRKALWVDQDGTVTAAGAIIPDWFAWGQKEKQDEIRCINPLVLTEYVLEFFRLVYGTLKPRGPHGPWTFRILLRGLKSRGTSVRLARHYDRFWAMEEPRVASGDGDCVEFVGTDNAAVDATRALEWMYCYFGMPLSENPFVEGGQISEAKVGDVK